MSQHFTYEQIAGNFNLWAEYVDPDATMTEEQFNAMSIAEKVQIQTDAFGPEQVAADNGADE